MSEQTELELKTKKLSLREQLEMQQAENECVIKDLEAREQFIAAFLEDKRISEHVRREYTQMYVEMVDSAEL